MSKHCNDSTVCLSKLLQMRLVCSHKTLRVRYHQERWDGSGYPIGLSGKDIPYLARIFAVADAFDALTSDRPYRRRIQAEEALQYLREQAGVLFDPQIIQTMEQLASQGLLDGISPK